jgi:hypothetical protein
MPKYHVANVGNFLMIRDILQTKDIDVLILDLELKVFLVFLK